MSVNLVRKMLSRCGGKQLKHIVEQASKIQNVETGKISYSQCGEDMIIRGIFDRLNMPKITYLDIGAHHPTFFNNTYYFYRMGSHGVCIEPNPALFQEIKNKRKRDICLNIGVGIDDDTEAEFYVMNSALLSTFSKEEANYLQRLENHTVEKIIKLPLLSITNVLQKHFSDCPDFISLDVEGLDLNILRSIDFTTFRPKVICVESIVYTNDRSIVKEQAILDYMLDKKYFVFADTSINSILVDSDIWFREQLLKR